MNKCSCVNGQHSNHTVAYGWYQRTSSNEQAYTTYPPTLLAAITRTCMHVVYRL